MRNPDRLLGAVAVLVGCAVIGLSQRFPAGQPDLPGPAFFPGLLGGCFLLCGLLLLFYPGAEQREKRLRVTRAGAMRMAEVIGSIVFYIVLAESLGFPVTALAMTLFLLRRLGNSWRVALAVSLPLVAGTFLLFNKVFLVQLPRGF